MLVSAQANLIFAHFPKTAGTSMTEFLLGEIPDMRRLQPEGDQHLGVGAGLRLLQQRNRPISRLSHKVAERMGFERYFRVSK